MSSLKGVFRPLRSFITSHGFALLTTLSISIIAATALWTRKTPIQTFPATPPALNLPAAVSLQESITAADHAQQTPTVTNAWQSPLSEYQVIRPFTDASMLRSESTGLWSVHAGADLAAPQGSPVRAMFSGCVETVSRDDPEGCWISLQHSNGYVTRYSALQMSASFQAGDSVRTGDVIGFVGNTHIGETALGPHLHLEVIHNGTPVDPLPLFE